MFDLKEGLKWATIIMVSVGILLGSIFWLVQNFDIFQILVIILIGLFIFLVIIFGMGVHYE